MPSVEFVVVRLQRPVGVLVVDVPPARQHVFARVVDVARLQLRITAAGQRVMPLSARLADVMVALDGQGVRLVERSRFPIGAEAEAALLPGVVRPGRWDRSRDRGRNTCRRRGSSRSSPIWPP